MLHRIIKFKKSFHYEYIKIYFLNKKSFNFLSFDFVKFSLKSLLNSLIPNDMRLLVRDTSMNNFINDFIIFNTQRLFFERIANFLKILE